MALLLIVMAGMSAKEQMDLMPGPDGVRLADAMEFGIHPCGVQGFWVQAREHAGLMRETMRAQNTEEVVWAWERDCDWRARSWDQLDNVLRCSMTYEAKMACLMKLKTLIGEELWEARIMPSPTPNYRGIR